jgi:hypothetical protein
VVRRPDCSHGPLAIEAIVRIAGQLGLDIRVDDVVIATDDEAKAHRCLGSPTLLIAGNDVEPAARADDVRRHLEGSIPARRRVVPGSGDTMLIAAFERPGGVSEMDSRSRIAFALVILAQAAHSVEECVFRLFDVRAGALGQRPVPVPTSPWASPWETSASCSWRLVLLGQGASLSSWCAGVCLVLGLSRARQRDEPRSCSRLRGTHFPGVGTASLLIATSCYLGFRLVTAGQRAES